MGTKPRGFCHLVLILLHVCVCMYVCIYNISLYGPYIRRPATRSFANITPLAFGETSLRGSRRNRNIRVSPVYSYVLIVSELNKAPSAAQLEIKSQGSVSLGAAHLQLFSWETPWRKAIFRLCEEGVLLLSRTLAGLLLRNLD